MATAGTSRPRTATGRRIRDYRESKGLSPEAFGARVNVSGRTIRRIEHPLRPITPQVRTMFLIARELDMEVKDLWRL